MKEYGPDEILIWLCSCTGLDQRERVALLRAAGSPERLFGDFEKYFAELIKKPARGLYKSSGLSARRKELEELLVRMKRADIFTVTVSDQEYPEALKAIADPPLVLFGKGNRELLTRKKFCIVGSRITPPWAEKLGSAVAARLSRRFTIVTGIAEGGDIAAARGALGEGNLICVLPNGLDGCYPASHAAWKEEIGRHGLLISEYPLGEGVKKYYFHARNRILAGLSEGVLVISAGARSGALMTANYAAEYGRDVFAFPYNPGISQGVGCNELIKRGAGLCTDAEDIFSAFGMHDEAIDPPVLSREEHRVLAILRAEGELHAQLVAERAGMQIYEATAVLAALELKGLAVKAGGNRYAAL